MAFSQKDKIAAAAVATTDDFTRWDDKLRAAANKYAIDDWRWLKAIMWNESTLGRAKSVARGLAAPDDVDGSASSDGLSWGLMQVTLKTAQGMRPGTTVQDLNNPDISIDLGARYLSQMLRRYGGQIERAVRAYNQGPGNEDKGYSYADDYLDEFNAHLGEIESRQDR